MNRVEPTLIWPKAYSAADPRETKRQRAEMAAATTNSSPSTDPVQNNQAIDQTPRLAAPQPGRDVRNMSPRELANMAHDLYMEGVFSWDEYKMAGFPPELDARYDQTIGALTGETAKPDSPRDMVAEWQEKLDFTKRYYEPDSEMVRRTERIVGVLKWQDVPKINFNV